MHADREYNKVQIICLAFIEVFARELLHSVVLIFFKIYVRSTNGIN